MRVRNIMTAEPDVVTIEAGDSVARAAAQIVEHGIGALPVIDRARRPVGLVAERDVTRAVHDHPEGIRDVAVLRVMQRPAPVCEVDDEIRPVMTRMTRNRQRHLVVCEEGRLAGVLSVGDLLKHRLDELEVEAAVLRDYVAGQRSRT